MNNSELLRIIRNQFVLNLDGIHGESHWGRVYTNGIQLAKQTGARLQVVELFAFLHDSKRCADGLDVGHGQRAAIFAESLCGSAFHLDAPDLDLLITACRGHSDGLTTGDITVLTCWDADRLDLGRVGILPQPGRLCTKAARDSAMIQWAYQRSLR